MPSNVSQNYLGSLGRVYYHSYVLPSSDPSEPKPAPYSIILLSIDYDSARELVEHSCNIENDSVLVKTPH